MQFSTGTVIDGKVVVELTREEEDELLAAMAEIERGECVSAEQLLASLHKYG